MTTTSLSRTSRTLGPVAAGLPIAAALGVVGVIYGATAQPVLGGPLTLASSILSFSGAAQFSMVGLLAAGADAVAVLGAVGALTLRYLPLGALLRPRLQGSTPRRALLAWFLTDETTGLALTRPEPVERTLVVTGAMAYGAWIVGTAAGVVGADLAAAAGLADALFPVLFVGLAALTAQDGRDRVLALVTGVVAVGLLLALPGVGVLGVLAAAVAITVVGTRR